MNAGQETTRLFTGDHAPTVENAIVINDGGAVVNAETLPFYFRGVFKASDEDYQWAMKNFGNFSPSDTLEDIDAKIDKTLSKLSNQASESDLRRASAFYSHREQSARNRRAYRIEGRVNKNTVFWPDPRQKDRRSLYRELPFARRFPILDKDTKVVSAGSCFAMEIAHALQKDGYNYLVKEPNKGAPGSYEIVGAAEMPNASAAWGIIFNTPSFLQLVEKAFGIRKLPRIVWTQKVSGKNRFLDPFREDIAFDSLEAYNANYDEHLKATREAFLEMEIFVITLGLNEVWYFKADGSVFSRSPWRTAPHLVGYKVLTVEENVNDLIRMADILKSYNKNVKIICTLSPVPLHATFRGDDYHVATANSHSKAVLRVAAEEFERRCSNVFYFPSYEVVTTMTEHPWEADQRHVSREAVENVMTLFHKMYDKV